MNKMAENKRTGEYDTVSWDYEKPAYGYSEGVSARIIFGFTAGAFLTGFKVHRCR